jgi:glycosyltransferase involved in cell wall biosynthesis
MTAVFQPSRGGDDGLSAVLSRSASRARNCPDARRAREKAHRGVDKRGQILRLPARHRIVVSSVEEAAARTVQLIKDEKLRKQMGERARESVKEQFLLTRLLEQYLDLFTSFETIHRLRDRCYPS